MKSIRIGNDIRIEWPIVLSGDVSKLQDFDLTVEVRPSAKVVDWHNYIEQPTLHRGKHSVMMNGGIAFRPDIGDGKEHSHPHRPKPVVPYVKLPYHIEENKLIAMWTADRQFATGDYDIILYAHKNEGGQAVCDQYRFVRLVSHTAQADSPDDSGIEAVITMQPLTLSLSGLSAYEVAVVNGFQGSVEEWLESLKAGKLSSYVSVESIDNLPQQGDESTGYIIGTKLYIYLGTGGDTLEGKYKDVGEFRGPQGAPGSNGKSAYELAVEGGYEGSVEEWLLSLKGRDGVDGVNGADGLDGENGKDGVTPLIRWNNNRIEQSTDNGKSWWALSDKFNNKLYIKGYVTSADKLPKNALVGDMYGVGPIYGDDDVEQTKPYYQVYVNTVTDWAKSATITKVYQGDMELPQSAENNEIILIKKSTDNYLVYKYVNGSWNLLANLAEIYVEKDDIVNRGDNIFALVQSEIENQYELYERVVSWRNSGTFTSITAGIVNELGNSENAVMSQKAVTDAILNKIDLSAIDFDAQTIAKLALATIPTRYNVISSNKSVGIMEVFSDNNGHMVTEVFDTHYIVENGELTGGHSDDKTFRYMRSYHLVEGGTSDIPVGTWGEWKQVYSSDNQKDVDALKTSVNNLNANTGIDEYEEFSDQKAYSAGDTVLYNGLLYTFKVDHAIGAWDETQVEETSLKGEIDSAKIFTGQISPLSNIDFIIDSETKNVTININGTINILDNQGTFIKVVSDYPKQYLLKEYYSLLLNITTKELYVETLAKKQNSSNLILAYNEHGNIIAGYLANYFSYKIQESINTSINEDLRVNEAIIRANTELSIKDIILYGKAYDDENGTLKNYKLLDCTSLIEVPIGTEYVSISKLPFYNISCFDVDMSYLGNRLTVPNVPQQMGWLFPNTRYISISFLKSDNIDYSNLYISFDKGDYYKLSSNLGLTPPILISKAYKTDTGILTTFRELDCTSLIPISDALNNKKLSVKINVPFFEIACFDENKTFIGPIYKNTTLKEKTKYFSVSFLKSDNIDYSELFISVYEISNNLIIPTPKKNKKYYLFGDSITYWDSRTSWYDPEVYMVAYPSYIRDLLDANIVNMGIAGNTSNAITTRLLSTDLSDAYALTYMAGANDLHASVAIGEIGNLDRSTYIGNLSTAAEYVLTNYPNVKMYFLSPLWETNGGKGGYEEYAQAMENVARHYHLPILRWDILSGIGELNADTFYVHEDTTRLHPNNDGHKRLADCLIPFLQIY